MAQRAQLFILLSGAGLGLMGLQAAEITQSASETLSITLSSAAKVSVPATVTLSSSGTFQNFTGSELVNFKARTTSSGSATVTVKGSSEFSPVTGPAIANGDLTYTCGSATLGTACSGTQTASTASSTSVVSVGASKCVGTGCAATSPATITLSFTLTNSPAFKTGSYSAQLLYTCSAI